MDDQNKEMLFERLEAMVDRMEQSAASIERELRHMQTLSAKIDANLARETDTNLQVER